jgi:hypothetical protein
MRAMRLLGAVAASLLLAGVTLGADQAAKQVLFNGKDLSGWRQPTGEWMAVGNVRLDPADSKKFLLEPGTGALVTGAKGQTVNLLTAAEFGDMEANIELCIPSKSNSGIYFMGRYEVQVYDSHGVAKDKYPGIECGGIYPRWTQQKGEFEGHSPRVNASKPAGEWQRFAVVFRAPRFDASGKKVQNARFLKVVHNGQVIHENVDLTGPTRAAAFENDEKPLGPLMFQGDHGPVAYRNLWIKPVKLP